ncbi:MAG: mechanosensitive ion channel [Deltaproteobacteria bacterium]|nr:mechanosensitive ion channel [Deltaproteobacteria bacterium]
MRTFHLYSPKDNLLKPLLIALGFFFAAALVKAGMLVFAANGLAVKHYLDIGEKAFIVFMTLGAVFLLRWIIADAPFNLLRRHTVAPLFKAIISLFLYFGAIMFLLNRLLGINLLPLLTTSAVLTGIIALSLQETLKNLFTGLWINMDRIVAKGDWVKVAEKEGQIVDVTWRTTRILTRDNDLIYLPNRFLAEGVLENYTYPTPIHIVQVDIGASYNDPPNKVKELLMDIAMDTPDVLVDPVPEVLVLSYGDFSINYRLRVCINDFNLASRIKSDLNSRIWYVFRRHDVEIPFPIRTIYTRTEAKQRSTAEIISSFKDISFLKMLKEDELARIAASARVESFGAGEAIVKQGEKGDTCYILKKGSADVLLKDVLENESLIATVKAGDFFGEMSLLAGEPRSATVIAKEDSACIVIGSQEFHEIFRDNPEIAEKLSEILAKRSSELNLIKSKNISKLHAETEIQKNILSKIKTFFKLS